MEKAVRGIETVWTLLKISIVLFLVAWFVISKMGTADSVKPKAFAEYLASASPLETPQRYTLNKHAMPTLASVLPAITEQERLQHPGATAVQIARAKWIERTWNEVEQRGEPERKVNGGEKSFLASLGAEVMGKDAKAEGADAKPGTVQLLVGSDVVPALASGKLPVFSEADTVKYQAEQAKQGLALYELDYRRALWFVLKFGAGNKPAVAPEDAEIRAVEAASKPKPDAWGRVERQVIAPWSENERMARAVDVLNVIYAPTPAAAPAAAVAQTAGGK